MNGRRYYDTVDLLDAAGLIAHHCRHSMCHECVFGRVNEETKEYYCKLHDIPSKWEDKRKG